MEAAESTFKRTLGATILELRVANGISSQGALAARLREMGVAASEATVRRWEKGTHSPDAWELNRLCALFGVEPADLIHPAPMTDREVQVLRRAARQVHRTIDRAREAS
jgi:transcriptional regulator with XRE-family HTH domain